ncbi:MAG: hypothetical protein M5U10_11735 [Candidatus Methanoperedens sp.]|uniref:hypothetical protein n=1 Tax=Candidatus Methanoperedens nitratireducens TaxID=1392998 RepID=UPI00064E9488|nr:hypothetical protein [Candidatus Methanoperedens nitroreducens]MDJ1422572.1 hypothetical protein [Candidatus Methanoperedens sp.]
MIYTCTGTRQREVERQAAEILSNLEQQGGGYNYQLSVIKTSRTEWTGSLIVGFHKDKSK